MHMRVINVLLVVAAALVWVPGCSAEWGIVVDMGSSGALLLLLVMSRHRCGRWPMLFMIALGTLGTLPMLCLTPPPRRPADR